MTLDEALVLFAKTRSSELTAVIETLGREAVEAFTPPSPKKNLEFHRTWQQLARDPSTRTWCLETLIDKLPRLIDGKEHGSGDKLDAALERLETLCLCEPDPRIARVMLELYELRSPTLGFVLALEAMARALVLHADDQTGSSPLIAELAEQEEVAPIFAATPFPKPRALDATTSARAGQVKRAARRDLSGLLGAVFAAPDADEPREVLADALQEAGDPRGEFIALQLREHRGQATDEVRRRAQHLLETHGNAWLGALRPIVARAVLRRGFLHRLELAGSWSSNKWSQLAADPMLATVEELGAGQATGKIYAAFLAGPIAKTVRSIEVFDDEIWSVLTTTPMPRLRELVATWWKRRAYAERFEARVLPWLSSHEQITRVAVDDEVVGTLPQALLARLTDLRINGELKSLSRHWAAWSHLHTLTTGNFEQLSLVREGTREHARLTANRYGWSLELKGLPSTIKRVEVFNNAKAAKELAAKVGKRFEIVALPTPSGTITGVK